MSDEIRWVEDLPEARYGGTINWTERLRPLMEREGVWAEVKRARGSQASTALHLRIGQVKHPPGKWEFVSRTDPVTREGLLFARFMGDE